MIDRIIEFSIRNRFAVILAAALLAAWGVYAVYHTPMDAIPDLSENQVIVFTEWPGHSPHEIEDQVTYPLALHLQGLAGVRTVRSSSDFSFSMISVIFEDTVEFHAARRQVAERLAQVSGNLPQGVVPTLAPDASATGQIFWYTVEGGGLDLGRLRALQDWYIRPQLNAVPGVAEVASVGGHVIEYQIDVDPQLLREHGIALREVTQAVTRSNSAVGGNVIEKNNVEYVVRGIGWIGGRSPADPPEEASAFDPQRALRDLEKIVVPLGDGRYVRVAEVASVTLGTQARRGVLEKDGNEVTGGVVLMRYGENPLEVTRRIKQKIQELQAGLPQGVRIVPFYDRTPLIEGAVWTVTGTLAEAILTATICVLLVLLHLRTSFIIALTLPLATLASFAAMWTLRRLGIVDIQTNIMSLAGIAISIGVLVDASIVMAENSMFCLKNHYGDLPVRGDTRAIVLAACQTVGRPIFFSVVIMLLSFLPVFALGGLEGKMFHPLAFTKSFALLAVALLAITLVPALCTIFIRGRLRSEQQSWLVRGVIEVYRPVLAYLLAWPALLIWFVGVTLIVGLTPLGSKPVFLATLLAALVAGAWAARTSLGRIGVVLSLVLIALVAQQTMAPLGREFMTPLDEGMIMDMPITVPRTSITEAANDLKARNMIFCRFPEVDMVVGKAGRADTPTDPAPLDMIETMVNFRPQEFWPKRKLRHEDAARQAGAVLDALRDRGVVKLAEAGPTRSALVEELTHATLPLYDAQIREYAYQRNQEFSRDLERRLSTAEKQSDTHDRLWLQHVQRLNDELLDRAAGVYTRLVLEECLSTLVVKDAGVASFLKEIRRVRSQSAKGGNAGHHDHGGGMMEPLPALDPQPALDGVQRDLTAHFRQSLLLWRMDRADLAGFGGELDQAMQMPGWTNVWTMPIQNRVDMLSTGVNTTLGVRVLGRTLADVVRASEEIAAVLRHVPGAADVVADPVRGKGYLEVLLDRDKAAQHGINAGDVNDLVETALGGKVVTTAMAGRERYPVRVRYPRAFRENEETVADLFVAASGRPGGGPPRQVPLAEVADVRVVEGPAAIKSENGLLRNYVRLNVRGRDAADFVAEARQVVAERVNLPSGVYLEWTGQFEHEARARKTLIFILPLIVGLIFLILYWTYHDLADALLMLLAVPGAIAGGVFFQWLFGYKFSVTVWVGYIACFGMATATGIIMLVYLREALAKAGGLERVTLEQLRQAVMDGAVHRLRPKLLTEGTIILGLAPMLWASGTGAEVIKPMAAPVLGGILIADEVIDLLLPVLFYWVRRRRWERLHAVPRRIKPVSAPLASASG
jgi:Cu(I)/Ag(I) efflux system membrane protein CusA/SilA